LSKFLSWNFAIVMLLCIILFIVHEFGHFLAYRVFGYQAEVRKSFFTPGIDPKETIEVPRWQGICIALSGFFVSTISVVFPLFLINYQHWFVLLIGSIAGASVDAIWAVSMLTSKTVTINSGNNKV